MSVEDQIDALRLQIEQLETVGRLEAQLVEAKESGADREDYRDLKNDLREARRQFRENRQAEANVSPDTFGTSAVVEEM